MQYMNSDDAIGAFLALGQETRLAAFRLLMARNLELRPQARLTHGSAYPWNQMVQQILQMKLKRYVQQCGQTQSKIYGEKN